MNGAIGFDEDYQKTIADIEEFEVDGWNENCSTNPGFVCLKYTFSQKNYSLDFQDIIYFLQSCNLNTINFVGLVNPTFYLFVLNKFFC